MISQTLKKIIEKGKAKMLGGKIADKYILYFEKDELKEIEEGYAMLQILDEQIIFWSKSSNLDALLEFENLESQ